MNQINDNTKQLVIKILLKVKYQAKSFIKNSIPKIWDNI